MTIYIPVKTRWRRYGHWCKADSDAHWRFGAERPRYRLGAGTRHTNKAMIAYSCRRALSETSNRQIRWSYRKLKVDSWDQSRSTRARLKQDRRFFWIG